MVGLGIVNEMKAAQADEDGVAKMAAPNHISPLLLSITEQSAPGLPTGPSSARPSPSRYPKARGSNSCQVRLLLYPESILLYRSSRPIPTIINLVRLLR